MVAVEQVKKSFPYAVCLSCLKNETLSPVLHDALVLLLESAFVDVEPMQKVVLCSPIQVWSQLQEIQLAGPTSDVSSEYGDKNHRALRRILLSKIQDVRSHRDYASCTGPNFVHLMHSISACLRLVGTLISLGYYSEGVDELVLPMVNLLDGDKDATIALHGHSSTQV